MDDIQKAIFDAVNKIVSKKIKECNFCYYIDGEIIQENSDGTYNIQQGNSIYRNVPARTDKSYLVGDVVQVCIKNGDSSRKFIDDYRLI